MYIHVKSQEVPTYIGKPSTNKLGFELERRLLLRSRKLNEREAYVKREEGHFGANSVSGNQGKY